MVKDWTDADWRNFVAMSARLRMDPKMLAEVLWSESGGDPHAANPPTGRPVAVGLAQFTKVTNSLTGLTEDERVALVGAPVSTQLPLIEKLYASLRWTKEGRPYETVGKIYQAQAAPSSMFSAPGPNDPIAKEGDALYTYYKSMDRNGDGVLTSSDLEAFASRVIPTKSFQAALAQIDAAKSSAGPGKSSGTYGGSIWKPVGVAVAAVVALRYILR